MRAYRIHINDDNGKVFGVAFDMCPYYALIRASDGARDAGPMLLALGIDGEANLPNTLRIGRCCRVGSYTARMHQIQDYWQTTPVTEIDISGIGRGIIRFNTKNSRYLLTIL